jgi:predicted amidophosphoribosyltransferase
MMISPVSAQRMISSLTFASCYIYAPGGGCNVSERSRSLCSLLKAGDARLILKYAQLVKHHAGECAALAGFFDSSDVLVPVPGSEPRDPALRSVASLLAEALVHEGLAGAHWQCIRRVQRVRKSATAAPRERPTAQRHYDSLAVEFTQVAGDPARMTLVDDVVTRGRTLLAAATRLHDAFPNARIQGFALLRTMGFAARVDRLWDPCIGEITWRGGDARRNP